MHIFLLFLVLVSSANAQGCVLVTAPCDDTWGSAVNQTFAYVLVSATSVQLNSYWGEANWGCINSALTVGQTNCQTIEPSTWVYSPGDIKNFVSYQNVQTSMCLTNMGSGVVTLATCLGVNYPDSQLWLEPQGSDPYNRIISKVNFNLPPIPTHRWCLTRVNTPGQPRDGPCL